MKEVPGLFRIGGLSPFPKVVMKNMALVQAPENFLLLVNTTLLVKIYFFGLLHTCFLPGVRFVRKQRFLVSCQMSLATQKEKLSD